MYMKGNVFKDFILSKKTLTDKLFDEVSDYDIYCELTDFEFEIGKPAISPVRVDDDMPSFSLFIPTKIHNIREEELWWRDFRDGSGDIFKFTRLFAKLHYGVILETRKDIIEFIDDQLGLGILNKNNTKKYNKRALDYDKLKESIEILFTSRPYTKRDILWWAHYGVDIELLTEHDIRSIRYLLDENYNIRKKVSIYDLAFAFVVYDKVKVYMPEAHATKKWRNTCPTEYIQGWTQLKGYDTLIITKSYKDILVFKSFMNVDVIAPQSESNSFNDNQIEFIKSNYKNVFVVYDYDAAGQIGSAKLKSQYGFSVRWVSTKINPEIEKPDDKDMSDYIFNHSFKAGITRMQNMFPELNDSYFRLDRVTYFEKLLKSLIDNT